MEDTPPQKDFEPFRIKEKVGDMMKYGMPITYGFSRRNKELADEIRRSMLTMYRLTVKIEKKYFKKTTTQDHDPRPRRRTGRAAAFDTDGRRQRLQRPQICPTPYAAPRRSMEPHER